MLDRRRLKPCLVAAGAAFWTAVVLFPVGSWAVRPSGIGALVEVNDRPRCAWPDQRAWPSKDGPEIDGGAAAKRSIWPTCLARKFSLQERDQLPGT